MAAVPIAFPSRPTDQQRAVIREALDDLEDTFDAGNFAERLRADAHMTTSDITAAIEDTIVDNVSTALVKQTGADVSTASRLARLNAPSLASRLAAEVKATPVRDPRRIEDIEAELGYSLAIGHDGMLTDPRHPFNRGGRSYRI
jgi:hypothetical protein